MAIILTLIESGEQVIANIPKNITISADQPCNIFYTLDGSTPDPTGVSLTTYILETTAPSHLTGIVFLPTNNNFLALNILAIGTDPTNTGAFYRRYGLDPRNINMGRPSVKRPIQNYSGYINTISPNIAPDGSIIAADGYSEGSVVSYKVRERGFDGYVDAYGVAVSGQQTAIPPVKYDHIDGYGEDGYVISTTNLTPAQELNLLKLTDRGDIYVDDGYGLVQDNALLNIDPRSSSVVDEAGRQIEVIPIAATPTNDGYTIDGYWIDDNYDNAPEVPYVAITSGGMFNPRAAYIEIDGRVDGYINGTPIEKDDRTIINKPFQEIRYKLSREDLGDAIRTNGILTGSALRPIIDYARGNVVYTYFDSFDNRYIQSIQKFTPPKYELIAKRNGQVVGWVFKWITNKGQKLL